MGKCNEKIIRLIKKIDCFGTFITFRVDDEIEYKSIIGGIFTLVYVLIAILFITMMSIKFIGKKNLNLIYSKKIAQKPFLNLTEINFNFAFGAQFSKSALPAIKNSSKYFYYSLNLVEYISSNNITGKENIIRTPMGIRRCETNDFPQLGEHYFLNDLNYLICPIINSTSNFSVDGLYTESYYKEISINVHLTDYAINNFNELEIYLTETPIEIVVFYKDSAIDYLNKENPLPSYLNFYYKLIDHEFFKVSEISFSRIEFSSDDNLLFDEPKYFINVIHSSVHDNFKYVKSRKNEDDEKRVCEFIFHASSEITQLKRTYQKVPEFAASISGILGFLFLVMIVFANIIERKAVDQKLIHKMLKFRGNKNINIDYFLEKFSKNLNLEFMPIIKKKANSYSETKNISEKINGEDSNNNNDNQILKNNSSIFEGMSTINFESIPYKTGNDLNESQKRINKKEEIKSKISDKSIANNSKKKINLLNKKTIDLDIGFFDTSDIKNIKNPEINPQTPKSKKQQDELNKLNLCQIIINFFCFWCTPKSYRKNKLIKSAEKKIHYYMDIITYVKTIQEFELLKEMFFNENTLRIFQFASKPTMKTMDGDFIFCHHFVKEYKPFKRIEKKEIDQLYQNYKEILQSERTFENLKLLNFIKSEIKFLQS